MNQVYVVFYFNEDWNEYAFRKVCASPESANEYIKKLEQDNDRIQCIIRIEDVLP